ncbi:MAG TPA: sigma factor-like helix-turn-helix DNA-binding protein [Thermoanaerobaculia bacterium]|nr:sigma factor-like helix-turn-helix DNA-binding protein [Thermoanaerobaculia bacterium]
MSASKGFFGTQHPFAEAEHEELYHTLGGFLQGLLVRQFDVPQEDAELLVYEAFVSYFTRNLPFRNARTWLIGAACSNANTWRARRGLPPENGTEIAQNAGKRLPHREAVAMLPEERARKALRLRFEEKKDYPEIAAELGVSTFAAKRIVAKAVAELRGVLRRER